MTAITWVLVGLFFLLIIFMVYYSNNAFIVFYNTYQKYADQKSSSKMTGYDLAKEASLRYFKGKLKIGSIEGELRDAYDFKNRAIYLSPTSRTSSAIASLAVVAHEIGHAMQQNEQNKKFIRATRLKSLISALGVMFIPFLIVGIVMIFFPGIVLYIGLGFLGLSALLFMAALFAKITLLPVERDASKKALDILVELGALMPSELGMADEVLTAAYRTYVADFFRAILRFTFLTKKSKLF